MAHVRVHGTTPPGVARVVVILVPYSCVTVLLTDADAAAAAAGNK